MNALSKFDKFGGYYSVLMDGIEIARYAPSYEWTDYAASMKDDPSWSYEWVDTDV